MPRFTSATPLALWLALCFLLNACAPFVVPEGPAAAEPAFTQEGYKTSDGLRLPFFEWRPAEPKAVVLALHGFGDYSNAFDKVATALAERGFATYAYDQRGFGVSPGRGRWHGAERLVEDAAEAVGALQRRHPGLPLYLMGHSMGGGVAMAAVAQSPKMPVAGLILIAPAVWGRDNMPSFQKDLLRLSAYSVPWYPLTGQGIRIVPTDDLAALRALSRDPKVLRAFRVDQVWGLTNLMDLAAGAPPAIGTKTLYLYGLRDDVIPLRPTKAALAGFSESVLTAAIYDDGYHLLMRSTLGDAVIRDIAQWIEDPSAPLPSGADRDWQKRLDQR